MEELTFKHIMTYWVFVYVPMGPSVVPDVRDVYIYLEDSTITHSYVKFYLLNNKFGTGIENETVVGDYSLKTNYTNSNVSMATPTFMFEISGYGRANISGYKGDKQISVIWVDALYDSVSPTVMAMNGSHVEYEYGAPANICFILSDDASPTTYKVMLNNTQIMTGKYYQNYVLCIDINSFITSSGIYILDVYAYDSDMNSMWNETVVKVLPSEAPNILSLNGTQIEYEYGLQVKACFNITDESPSNYEILLNNTEIASGTYSSGEIVCVELWNYIDSAGTYELNITAYDKAGNVGSESLIVKVLPASPPVIVDSPEDNYTLTISENITLNWTAVDATPGEYKIYVNGTIKSEGDWSNNTLISYIFKAESAGSYNITIVFTDKVGLSSSHTVIIEVQEVTTTPTTTETTTTTTALGFPYGLLLPIGILLIIVIIIALSMKRKKKIEE